MDNQAFLAITTGVAVGTITRHILLKDDYRNYPSYPNGHLIHLTIGFVAAALGSVAVPALLNEDYVAVTFLALAIQQFREVRRMEKATLLELEESELIQRGTAYIDGIAKSFEARTYVVLLASLVTSTTILLVPTHPVVRVVFGVTFGLLTQWFVWHATNDETVGNVADVSLGQLRIDGDALSVDEIYIMHVGLESQRQFLLENGVGVVVCPHNTAARITLSNLGSRQAIVHEVGRVVGVRRYHESRRDFSSGRIAFFLVPEFKDEEAILAIIRQVPLLESVRRKSVIEGGEEA